MWKVVFTGTTGERAALSPILHPRDLGVGTPQPPALSGRCLSAEWADVGYNYHENGDFVFHVVTCALAAGWRLPTPPPSQEAVGSR